MYAISQMIHEITTYEEFKAVIKDSGPKLVMITIKSCPACDIIKPKIEKYSEMPRYGDLYFTTLNIDDMDEGNSIATEYDIWSVPTLLFIKDNQVVRTLKGKVNDYELDDAFEAVLDSHTCC